LDWEEKEAERLMRLYPDEYAQKNKEAIESPPNGFVKSMPGLLKRHADIQACKHLMEKYGTGG
jgi:hypothetical protein